METYEALTKRIFKIPENQRGFAWQKVHLDALINDLKITRELGKNHYVGPVVIESLGVPLVEDDAGNSLPQVSLEDGQQRITTMAIISKYLSERLITEFGIGSGEYQSGLDLQKCYKRKMPGAGGHEFALISNENAEFEQMTKHILLGVGAAPPLNSSPLSRMHEMEGYVRDWVTGIDVDELLIWSSQIKAKTNFVKIDLDNSINKYLAFDSINSRGVTLTVFDKVKNLCCLITSLRTLGTKPEEEWIKALRKLESAGVSNLEDQFITDIYNVAHGVNLRPDQVHSTMVEEYGKLMFGADQDLSDTLEVFIGNWAEFAESFAFVTTKNRTPYYPRGGNVLCNAGGKKWMDKFDNLDYSDTCRALLATTHWKFSRVEFATVAEYCEKYAFRVYGVMNKPTSTNRKRLIITSHNVYSGNTLRYVKSVICWLLHHPKYGAPLKGVIGRLANGQPKYPFVSDGWDRCYYLLYEYDQRTTNNVAWTASKAEQEHTMEHIMPKGDNRTAYWAAEWPDEHAFEKFRHRLGNLVLTKDQSSNSFLGRKNIEDKIVDPVHAGLAPGYDYSNGTNSEKDIHTHADFTGARQWKKENILNREGAILKWAVLRWKLPCCDDNEDVQLPEEFDDDDGPIILSPDINENNCIDARGPDDEEIGQNDDDGFGEDNDEIEAEQNERGDGLLARLLGPSQSGQNTWIEHTENPDRPDRSRGKRALGKAIWSPQNNKRGNDSYRHMRAVGKGDRIIHIAGKGKKVHVRGVSIVKSPKFIDCKGMKDTNWDENRPCYKLNLEDYNQLDPLMYKEEFVNEANWDSLEEIRKRPDNNVFYNKKHDLNQGAYLTPCTEDLASLLNDAHIEFSGKALPHFEEAGGTLEGAGLRSLSELTENESGYSIRQRNIGPAWKGDEFVFGSERPNYGSGVNEGGVVIDWIPFMETKGIARVVCLLTEEDLEKWDSEINLQRLEEIYQSQFGTGNVCMSGIPDKDICTEMVLNNDIIPFLKKSVELEQKVVVHCSAGMGRTGHVLAAWRYCHHDVEYKEAMLSNNWECEDGRHPREAKGKPSDHLGRKVKESDYQNLLKSAKSGYDFL